MSCINVLCLQIPLSSAALRSVIPVSLEIMCIDLLAAIMWGPCRINCRTVHNAIWCGKDKVTDTGVPYFHLFLLQATLHAVLVRLDFLFNIFRLMFYCESIFFFLEKRWPYIIDLFQECLHNFEGFSLLIRAMPQWSTILHVTSYCMSSSYQIPPSVTCKATYHILGYVVSCPYKHVRTQN